MRDRVAMLVLLAASLGSMSCGEPTTIGGGGGSETAASGATADPPTSASASASETAAVDGTASATASASGGGPTTTTATTTIDPSSSSSDGGPTMGEPGTVRFVAFGDTGEGNESQQAVANAAEIVCAERGCDLALLLGDNFYDTGVTSELDQQFTDKFETVYEGLDMPFYVVLGNHDYGTLANDWNRGNYQVEYTQYSDKWVLPHFWYTFSSDSGGTQFFAFDTARMMWNHDVNDQRQWLANELQESSAAWKIAIAHHPYISNGEHGNAGNYEGLSWLPFVSGEPIKEVVEDIVCGQAQIYISGHDHNRQAFDPVCGTYFLVSGASAKTSDFVFRENNPTQWGDDTREGFLWIQIEGTELIGAFYDLDGNLDHEMTVSL